MATETAPEFGSGLRAHLDRRAAVPAAPAAAPELVPALPGQPVVAVERDPEPQRVAPQSRAEAGPQPQRPGPRGDLTSRIDALAAAEAEMAFRERRVAEREAAFNVAVQRVVYELAQAVVDGSVPALPQDELAVARARRRGRAA
jgi:hypothetical protein